MEKKRVVAWLPEQEFVQAVSALPLVSVDLVVVNSAGQLLLGLRRNAPARDWWFTPGGRVHKNESVAECLGRVALSELGVPFDRLRANGIGLSANGVGLSANRGVMGVWDHFYEDSAFSAEVSTHYVNLPYVLQLIHALDLDALPTEQHSGWRWQAAQEAAVADDVHPYVRLYAQWVVEQLTGV